MPRTFDTDRPTWDEIRAARKPRTDSVWIPLDGELLEEIAALEKIVAVAERADEREHRKPEAPGLARRLEELREKAEAAAVQFTFAEITRRQFRLLVDAAPPTLPGWRWDEDTFAPLLMAATATSPPLGDREQLLARLAPGVTADDLRPLAGPAFEIWDEWSQASCYLLYGTAHNLNAEATAVPFSVTATAATRGSGPSSTSASETDEPSDTTSS